MGGLADAGFWGAAWALFAVAAGMGLTVAAKALFQRMRVDQLAECDVGYNMLAPVLER